MADNTAPDPVETSDEPVALEDIEVSLDDIKDSEGETEEITEDVSEEEDKSEDESKPEEKESEEETKSDEQSTDEEEPEEEQSDEDKQKAYNNQMAQQRIQEKQIREAQQRDLQQRYVAEAEDDRDTALRQLQVDAYANKVEGNTNKLTNGYEKAIKDFPILADQTPEIRAEVDAAIDAFQAMHVKVDQWGNPSEVSGDLYKYLQSKANSIEKLTAIGARKQVDDKGKEKSKTILTPSRTPKEPKKDADMEAFNEEAYGKK